MILVLGIYTQTNELIERSRANHHNIPTLFVIGVPRLTRNGDSVTLLGDALWVLIFGHNGMVSISMNVNYMFYHSCLIVFYFAADVQGSTDASLSEWVHITKE